MTKVSGEATDMEVKPLHRVDMRREESSLHVPLHMAKARVGASVERAIGDEPRKAYGHEGQLSAVCSGERVPEYLARIYADSGARRRLALAWLEDDSEVIVTTTVTIPMKRRA